VAPRRIIDTLPQIAKPFCRVFFYGQNSFASLVYKESTITSKLGEGRVLGLLESGG
jgi:hypothetical protein